jgi:hypothetical protein
MKMSGATGGARTQHEVQSEMRPATNKNERSRNSHSPTGGDDITKRTPEELEDELDRMRDRSRAALRASWADAERLRTEAAETDARVQELRVLIDELKEEKELLHRRELEGDGENQANAGPGHLPVDVDVANGNSTVCRVASMGGSSAGDVHEIESTTEDADACQKPKRETWLGWDDGPGSTKVGDIDGGCSDGDAAAAAAAAAVEDEDDSICTEDLAMIERRFGATSVSSVSENLEGKSTATATSNNERRVSWQDNLGASVLHRRPSTVDRSVASVGGSLGRLDEDSEIDVSAAAVLSSGEDSNPSLHGGKAEERLMAALSSVQARMADETTKQQGCIRYRNECIERLRSVTKEQDDEIAILKKEYSSIQSSMSGEGIVLRCEIEALRSEVKRLLVQDAALDKELKKAAAPRRATIRSIQKQEQDDEVKRLRVQIVAANENLKNAKKRQARSVSISASAGIQPDGHSLQAESAVLIDIDSIADDMSDVTA